MDYRDKDPIKGSYKVSEDNLAKSINIQNKLEVEPKGIIKIVKIVLGWIFGKQPKKPKNEIPKDK